MKIMPTQLGGKHLPIIERELLKSICLNKIHQLIIY